MTTYYVQFDDDPFIFHVAADSAEDAAAERVADCYNCWSDDAVRL